MEFRRVWFGIETVHRDIERFLDDIFSRKPPARHFGPAPWQPEVDVYETDEAVILIAELGGVKREDLEVAADATTVIIRGERRAGYLETEANPGRVECHQLEIFWGPFERAVQLPASVDPDAAQAFFDDGLLRVVLPKRRDITHIRPRHT